MRRRARWWTAVWTAAALAGAATGGSCEQPPACFEGDFEACTCDDGQCGFAACDAARGEFGACGSCGVVPGTDQDCHVEETGSAGGGGGGTELLGFMATCEIDEQCETGLCHKFNAKGPKCSKPCKSAGDCPEPSPGCNMMGVCKAP